MAATEPNRNDFRGRLIRLVAGLLLLAAGAWLLFKPRITRQSLPDAADVRSIEASFYDHANQAHVEFQVPRVHWNAIYSALLPARTDANPAKWVGLGDLRLELANGKSYHVSLYNLDEETGAFSAGPTFDDRVYYRGGNSSQLETALAAAFVAADAKP